MAKTDVAIVTEMRDGILIPIPLIATALVLQGTFAVVNNAGLAISSANVGGANQVCLGVWDHSAENTGADGDVCGLVRRGGQFLFKNLAADPVTQAELGVNVYIADNQTVAKTHATNTRSVAGKFMGFDAQYTDHVWVEI